METVSIYKFDELSDGAKDRAIEDYRNKGYDYAWSEEARETMETFSRLHPITVTGWQYSPCDYNYVDFRINDENAEGLEGVRLYKWILHNVDMKIIEKWDHCPLTGYCMDHSILKTTAPIETCSKTAIMRG